MSSESFRCCRCNTGQSSRSERPFKTPPRRCRRSRHSQAMRGACRDRRTLHQSSPRSNSSHYPRNTDCRRFILIASVRRTAALSAMASTSPIIFAARGSLCRIASSKAPSPRNLPVQAADQVRVCHQSHDRQGARPHRAADAPGARRRGDRMRRRVRLYAQRSGAGSLFTTVAERCTMHGGRRVRLMTQSNGAARRRSSGRRPCAKPSADMPRLRSSKSPATACCIAAPCSAAASPLPARWPMAPPRPAPRRNRCKSQHGVWNPAT